MLLELHVQAPDVETAAPRFRNRCRGFAHEVKNPLAGLRRGGSSLPAASPEGDLAELAALVIAEADRLTALADRLPHASTKPHLAPLNIHEPIERTRRAGGRAKSAGAGARLRPACALRIDADRLAQLLLNLSHNHRAGARALT